MNEDKYDAKKSLIMDEYRKARTLQEKKRRILARKSGEEADTNNERQISIAKTLKKSMYKQQTMKRNAISISHWEGRNSTNVKSSINQYKGDLSI